MVETLEYPFLLQLIEERSVAFRTAIAAAPSLETRVPTCPEWTLVDLVQHLGQVHRFWAAICAAGPADAPSPAAMSTRAVRAPVERESLLAWSVESTDQLLTALRKTGPDLGCWTWWPGSQSPQNCAAVARHQVQEAAVHAYDAQATVGTAQPLPDELALDGVDEFLCTCCAGTVPWPHEPGVIDYHATEGRSWRLTLAGDGTSARQHASPGTMAETGGEDLFAASASLRGTASNLVLALYGRIPVDSLQSDGDGRIFDLLLEWDPDD